jgi:hypothetical protein
VRDAVQQARHGASIPARATWFLRGAQSYIPPRGAPTVVAKRCELQWIA